MTDAAVRGRVAGKTALVTGAASGIGAACARVLAAEGAHVVLTDSEDDGGQAVTRGIVGAGGRAEAHRLDVTDETAWLRLADVVAERHGGLDIAVNSAGTSVRQSRWPAEADLDEWRRVTEVNLTGVFLATRHALRLMEMRAPPRGSIVNISSIMGIVAQPGIGAYCASKGGVRAYSKSVALSCAERRVDVRVNTIHPGYVETPLFDRTLARYATREEGLTVFEALQPTGRLGRPEDIAYGALYLASDEAAFVTGAELVIDGGYTAR